MNEPVNYFGILAMIACVCAIGLDCQSDARRLVSARNVFILALMAWFLLEAVLLPRDIRTFTQTEINLGVVLVVCSLGAFLAGYSVFQGGVFDPVFRRLVRVDNQRVLWYVFLAVCVIGFMPLLIVAQGDVTAIVKDAFSSGRRWSSLFARNRYGGIKDAMLELQMFLRAAIPLAVAILFAPRQTFGKRGITLGFLIYMAAAGYNSGTRSKVLEVALPILAGIYWRLSADLKRKAIVFALPPLVLLGFVWSAASVIGRNEGRVAWDQAGEAEYVGFEMFRELLYIRSNVPERFPYRYGNTYWVQIVNPIPRFLWPSKPVEDAGLELAKMKGMVQNGDAYLTVSPGLVGEMYWNFGVPGIVIISAFLGYLAKSWDRLRPMASESILAFCFFAAGLAVIFLSGRSVTAATLYGMLSLCAVIMYFGRPRGRSSEARVPLVTAPPKPALVRQPHLVPVRKLDPDGGRPSNH
jgi:oligosaccharide repeat unit polymerase